MRCSLQEDQSDATCSSYIIACTVYLHQAVPAVSNGCSKYHIHIGIDEWKSRIRADTDSDADADSETNTAKMVKVVNA